jgi:hypothetical protein
MKKLKDPLKYSLIRLMAEFKLGSKEDKHIKEYEYKEIKENSA